jgi:hypothetical protein
MCDLSLLTVEAKIHLDLEDIARRIEYEFADYLLLPPKGIYIGNKVDPVMVDGGNYFIIDTVTSTRTPISDITNIKQSVYTEQQKVDKVIIPKTYMLNKQKYISSEPLLPYRGIKILEGFVQNQIDSFVKYRKVNKSKHDIVAQHFLNTNGDEFDNAVASIITLYGDLHDSIRLFMGLHNWHLYFTQFKDTRLTIEKSIDWRAYKWLCHVEECKEKKNANVNEYKDLGLF